MRDAVLVGHSTGAFVAVLCSIIINKSVFWALVHYFTSWFYVIWAVVMHLAKLSAFFEGL